jgi:hypothetical protein
MKANETITAIIIMKRFFINLWIKLFNLLRHYAACLSDIKGQSHAGSTMQGRF